MGGLKTDRAKAAMEFNAKLSRLGSGKASSEGSFLNQGILDVENDADYQRLKGKQMKKSTEKLENELIDLVDKTNGIQEHGSVQKSNNFYNNFHNIGKII